MSFITSQLDFTTFPAFLESFSGVHRFYPSMATPISLLSSSQRPQPPARVYTQSRLRICTTQEEVPSPEEQCSPPSPDRSFGPRPRRIPRNNRRLTAREALHGALGSDEPVDLLPTSSRKSFSRAPSTDAKLDNNDGASPSDSTCPEPISQTPLSLDDAKSPKHDAETEKGPAYDE